MKKIYIFLYCLYRENEVIKRGIFSTVEKEVRKAEMLFENYIDQLIRNRYEFDDTSYEYYEYEDGENFNEYFDNLTIY